MPESSLPRRWLQWLFIATTVFAAAALSGCATPAGGVGDTGGIPGASAGGPAPDDIVTESDEPVARKRARVRLSLAVGYFDQGQTTIALDEVKQALAIDPEFADAFNLRGLVYMRLNDQRLAEDSFRRALALKPSDGSVLHNYAWLMCQQQRYPEAISAVNQALANPTYGNRSKSLMARGLCEERAGQLAEAERSLAQSYELDAGNPVTAYNLSRLLFLRGENTRAQFYIRRLNNSELANAESFWLGIKVERRMDNREAMQQLAEQLRRRFPQSSELRAYERGNFNE